MKLVIDGHAEHIEAHEQLSSTIPDKSIAQWVKEVETWEENPASVQNPFETKFSCEYLS
jgi:hypothetical protein